MFLFMQILYVKCNILHIGDPNVQAREVRNHLAPALVVMHRT